MAIDRLGATSSLLAALRAEVSRSPRTAKTGASTEAATPEATTPEAGPPLRDAAVLRKELKEIVKGVAPNDEEATARARVKVVRAVLLWEFGPQLREHGEWQPMLDTLVTTLEANPVHRQTFAQLIRDLGE
ncbi:MAG: hypothetical protein ACREPE_01795 [Lysobacter sp.]